MNCVQKLTLVGLLMCVTQLLHAQNNTTSQRNGLTTFNEYTLSLTVGDVDTVFFAMPAADNAPNVSPSTTTIDPPDRVNNTGWNTLEVQNLSSTACDSLRIVVYGINANGSIVQGDSVLAGSITVSNTYGDKRVWHISLANHFTNVFGYWVKVSMGDLSGGTRSIRLRRIATS